MAQQEIRTQRENELAALKKTLEDEMGAHEEAIAGMRSKHSKAVEELNDQLESAKKVRPLKSSYLCTPCVTKMIECYRVLPPLLFLPPLPLPLPHSLSQSKQNMEKGKSKLEGENESLQLDLRDLRAAFAEGDKRRKTAEAQLSESQAKNTEDTAKIQDITSQNDKLKVWRNGIMAVWDMGLVRC